MANIFMKADDVKGESTVEGYEGWIEVEHVAYNYRSETSSTVGTGLAVGALVPGPVGVSSVEGEHVIRMLNLQGQGKHFQKIEIHFLKQGAGDSLKKYKGITLTEAMIQDYQPNGSSNAGGSEHLTFGYTKFELEYFKQDQRGGLTSVGSSSYDTKKKKVA